MKVEILEVRLSSDGYVGEQGDRLTVPDQVGAKWCAHGWARDLDGAIATGERRVVNARLDVDTGTHGVTSTEA